MRKLLFVLASSLLITLISLQVYSSNLSLQARLKEDPWPNETNTLNLSNVKFAFIKLKLPDNILKNIEIYNFSTPSLALTFENNGTRHLFFTLLTEENGFRDLYEKINVTNIYDFFHRIGNPDLSNKNIMKIRKIFGLDNAISFLHFKKGVIDAFFIQSKDDNDSKVFILIEGEDHIYKISGFLNKEIFNSILTNLDI